MIEWGEVWLGDSPVRFLNCDACFAGGRFSLRSLFIRHEARFGPWLLESPALVQCFAASELEEIIAKIKDLDRRTQAGEFDHLLGGKK
jgi:hypothetical protein